MKKAFITGGTGFVGSHLVEALLRRGYGEVRCMVRSKLRWLEGMDIVPVHCQLDDVDALREAIRDVDYVFHVAGLTRAKHWDAYETANIQGTLTLLEAVRTAETRVKKVVVTSSLAVVGTSAHPVATEETPLNPISQYGKSKALMEEAIVGDTLPLVIVRPPAVYGPRDADIFTFFQTVSKGICPVIGSGKDPDVSFVHARDLARGMVEAAEAEQTTGEVYFIGSEAQYSWNEVKDATTDALGRSALTLPIPERLVGVIGAVAEMGGRLFGTYPALNREKAMEIRHACKMCAVDKATRDFGYTQQIPLDEGVAETIAWYREKGWIR